MNTILKDVLGIEHYWVQVNFMPGRGQICLHVLSIAKDKGCLINFYKEKTMAVKAAVVDKCARKNLT